MTDVLLIHEDDGGNIEYVAGRATMSDGIFNAIYLSLFGGNERDSGLQADDPLEWWGNKEEPDPTKRYRSETQALLRSLPATAFNLKRLNAAIGNDLKWMTDTGFATFVSAEATIPALNRVAVEGRVEIDGRVFPFKFTQPWRSQVSG